MPNISPLFNGQTLFDANGQVLALGQIYTYQAGSTNPYPTYTNETGTVLQTNPIVLGADGKLNNLLWLQENIAYKLVVQTASGLQVDMYDNISGVVTSVPAIELLPTGVILLWSGAIGSIPSGWQLCDGTNGVPDLRDKFVIGSGGNYPPSTIGGSADAVVVAHSHTAVSSVTDPGHTHIVRANPGGESGAFGGGSSSAATNITSTSNTTGITVATTVNATGSSGIGANIPPFYALCYIQKL